MNKINILDALFHPPPIPIPILSQPDKITEHARSCTNTVDKASNMRQKEGNMPKGMELSANVYVFPTGGLGAKLMPRALRKPEPEPSMAPPRRNSYEEKRARFLRHIERRMEEVNNQLELLFHMGGSNYEYTSNEAEAIIQALNEWVEMIKSEFRKTQRMKLPAFQLPASIEEDLKR